MSTTATEEVTIVGSTEDTVDLRYRDSSFVCRYKKGSKGCVCHHGHVDAAGDFFGGTECALSTEADIEVSRTARAHFAAQTVEPETPGVEPEAFCERPGTRREHLTANDTVKCSGCGALWTGDSLLCRSCGTHL